MIDPVAALIALLLADAGLTALVANRVYGIPLPPDQELPVDANGMPHAAVLIQPAGGDDSPAVPVIGPRLYLRCHGPTAPASYAVYRALWPIFRDEHGRARGPRRIPGHGVLRSATLSAPDTDLEPERNWPVTVSVLETRWNAI